MLRACIVLRHRTFPRQRQGWRLRSSHTEQLLLSLLMQQDIDQISPIVKRPRARSISIAVSTSTAGQELQFIESPPLSSSQTSSTTSSSSVISTKLSSSPTTVMVQYRFIIGNLKKPRRRMGSWISTLGVAHTISKRNTGNAVAVIEIAGDTSSGSPHRPD